jgi:putative two-component system response regulator
MDKILLVEDENELREMTQMILEFGGYEVQSAFNGIEALEKLDLFSPDLIVSDISMPEMDGYALLEAVRARTSGVSLPFLFVSAHSQRADVTRARRLGVDDYLFKPFEAQELLDAVRIRLDRRRAVQLLDTREAHLQTVMMLANVIEARDPYTRGHVERVRDYAMALARALDWSPEALAVLEFGSILHDIGKIVVPLDVLKKAAPLTAGEQAIMHQHVEAGAHMLQGITHLQAAVPFILYHHEHWDGSGYPFGYSRESIPMEGRLLAIVDAYDAMTSSRPYRTGLPKEVALNEIRQGLDRHFDPAMAEVFLEISGDLP